MLRNTKCRTPRVDRSTVVCLFAPTGFSRCGIRPLIGQHTRDLLPCSVFWVAASNQIHSVKIRPALLSVSREKRTGAAHAFTTSDAAYAVELLWQIMVVEDQKHESMLFAPLSCAHFKSLLPLRQSVYQIVLFIQHHIKAYTSLPQKVTK